MPASFEVQTTVLPGHRIEFTAPQLVEGQEVTVVVLAAAGRSKRRLSEVLGDYAGGELFRTAQEVEDYLRSERDSWGS